MRTEAALRPEPTLNVRVRSITQEAESILAFELRPADAGVALPAFRAGAHIDVHLPDGQVRCYSLCNDPAETHRWCIGVHRDPKSRGGSIHLHEAVRPGALLQVGLPRNQFALDESAAANVFIAGGIGITPLLAMVARSRAHGTPWVLHYAARTRRHAGFLERLQQLAKDGSGEVRLHFDQEAGGLPLDLAAVVAPLPADAHVYCCGPASMLAAYDRATAGLPAARVHKEHFASTQAAATAGGYEVVLARSGTTLQVAAGQTLLECLIAAGNDPLHSCREGICGTCELRVLEGEPEHRDMVLSAEERAANDRILPCCSGSRSARLVLDF
jgi:vanillate O-demethylase ferredoxin subunit